jgi:ribosomal protein L11 methylase PrmA
MSITREESSYRDRDGYVFYQDGAIYRAIAKKYQSTWENVSQSEFFTALQSQDKLITFNDPTAAIALPADIYKIIEVKKIPFISYPAEWTFQQLKKAALLTLQIQKSALQNNFTLKDASAYNVQFNGPRPVFIDLFSFETYNTGEPWHAYGQFCRHFLAPLLLWHYGHEMKSLFLSNIDGIPVRTAAALLPVRSRLNLAAYTHIHLHAKLEERHAAKTGAGKKITVSKSRSLHIIEHLRQTIKSLHEKKERSHWDNYYNSCSYSELGYREKTGFVEKTLAGLSGGLCMDLGANTGAFSKIAARHFKYVVACDSDLEVVKAVQSEKIGNILALHVNLSNPTPAIGWNSAERKSFIGRMQGADCIMALALIHHICIGNNVPLQKLAGFFARLTPHLLIEWVPKEDPQVNRLLVTRKDIFEEYTLANFTEAFGKHYRIADQRSIAGGGRILFHLTIPAK